MLVLVAMVLVAGCALGSLDTSSDTSNTNDNPCRNWKIDGNKNTNCDPQDNGGKCVGYLFSSEQKVNIRVEGLCSSSCSCAWPAKVISGRTAFEPEKDAYLLEPKKDAGVVSGEGVIEFTCSALTCSRTETRDATTGEVIKGLSKGCPRECGSCIGGTVINQTELSDNRIQIKFGGGTCYPDSEGFDIICNVNGTQGNIFGSYYNCIDEKDPNFPNYLTVFAPGSKGVLEKVVCGTGGSYEAYCSQETNPETRLVCRRQLYEPELSQRCPS